MRKHACSIFVLILALAVASLPLAAQEQPEYCAFQISVNSPAGAPVKAVGVALKKTDGKTFSTAVTDDRGTVMICDAPEGLVDVEVGGHLCGAVTVRYLKAFWMTTRRVSVTYENCAGEEWIPSGGCLLTIRTMDTDGAPLSGVHFADHDKPLALQRQTWTSDRFGRIFRFIDYGKTLNARLEKTGYISQRVTDECKPGDTPDREHVIVLKKE